MLSLSLGITYHILLDKPFIDSIVGFWFVKHILDSKYPLLIPVCLISNKYSDDNYTLSNDECIKLLSLSMKHDESI